MHWSSWSLPGNSCRRLPPAARRRREPGPVEAKAAAIGAAQARPLTLEKVVKRAPAVAVAGVALYLVLLPKLIAALTVPDLIRGQQGRADAAADPFLPGSGTSGLSGQRPDASPQHAAGSPLSSKVITMGPLSG